MKPYCSVERYRENLHRNLKNVPSGEERFTILELSNPWPLSIIEETILKKFPQAQIEFITSQPSPEVRKAQVRKFEGGFSLADLLGILFGLMRKKGSVFILERDDRWDIGKRVFCAISGAKVIGVDGQVRAASELELTPGRSFLKTVLLRLVLKVIAALFAPGKAGGVEVRKILVVETGLMGDAVLAGPFIKSLRQSFPDAKVHVLASKEGEPVWSFLGGTDKTYVYSPVFLNENGVYTGREGSLLNAAVKAWSLVRALRREGYDVGFELKGDARNVWLLAFAGARQRVGRSIRSDLGFLDLSTALKLLTHPVPFDWDNRHSPHKWIQNLSILEAYTGEKAEAAQPSIKVKNDSFPEKYPQLAMKGYVVIQVGAGRPEKLWPRERFASLIKEVIYPAGLKAVLVGSPGEIDIGAQINRLSGGIAFDLTGKTSIEELALIVSNSILLVCHESGPMHLAGALGVPCVSIMSGSPSLFGPLDSRSIAILHELPCRKLIFEHCDCPWNAFACVKEMPYEDVISAVQKLTTKGAS